MYRVMLFCLAVLLPLAAQAEVPAGNFHSLATRHGMIDIRGNAPQERLYWNGRIIPGLEDGYLSIIGAWGRAEEDFDWVIVTHYGGGNACDPPYHALRVADAGVTVSPPIGGCVWPLRDLRVEPGRIELDLPGRALDVELETFVWDGATLTRTPRMQPPAPAAGSGAQVTRWIGSHPHSIFEDPSERARFAQILAPGLIDDLATSVSVANPVTQQGDWVIGQGCFPHRCNLQRGLWAIRIGDGATGAALLARDGPDRIFGHAATDPILRAAVAAHAL